MRFLRHALKVFASGHAVRCFDLAAKGRDKDALQLIILTRARIANEPRHPWDLELQLLQAFCIWKWATPNSLSKRSVELSIG